MRASSPRRSPPSARGALAGAAVAVSLALAAGCGGGGDGGVTDLGFRDSTLSGDYFVGELGLTLVPGAGDCNGFDAGGAAGDLRIFSRTSTQSTTGDGSFAVPAGSGFVQESCTSSGAWPPSTATVPYSISPLGDLVRDGSPGHVIDLGGAVYLQASTGVFGKYEVGLGVATAASGFDATSVQGRYAFALLVLELTGSARPSGPEELWSMIGYLTFDGAGDLVVDTTAEVRASTGGALTQPGTSDLDGGAGYAVAGDGTLSITLPTLGYELTGRVAAGSGVLVFAEETTPGVIALGVAVPSAEPFPAGTVAGDYRLAHVFVEASGLTLVDLGVTLGRLSIHANGSAGGSLRQNVFTEASPDSRLEGPVPVVVAGDGSFTVDTDRFLGHARTGGGAFVGMGGSSDTYELVLGFRR